MVHIKKNGVDFPLGDIDVNLSIDDIIKEVTVLQYNSLTDDDEGFYIVDSKIHLRKNKKDILLGSVDSVNNKSGIVTLEASDVGALPDSTILIFRNQSLSTTEYTLTNDNITVNSLIDVYYAENYDIQPTYRQEAGSFTIELDEAPANPIIFALKVVN